jgi:outer membrane immunogenic protein
MRILAWTTCAVLAITTSAAMAADLPSKAPPVAPLIPPPMFNWTGFYVGLFAGGAFSDGNMRVTERGSLPGPIGYNGLNHSWANSLGDSFIGGGTLGFNWQAPGSPFVFGIEGELGYLRMTGTTADPISPGRDTFASARIGDWYGLIAGRIGIAAWQSALFYFKGGVAFVEKAAAVTDNCNVAPCGPGLVASAFSDTEATWALGGGVEWAFAPGWSIKGEYLYIDTSETVRACGPGGGTAAGRTWCWDHHFPGVHTAKVGVNFRF